MDESFLFQDDEPDYNWENDCPAAEDEAESPGANDRDFIAALRSAAMIHLSAANIIELSSSLSGSSDEPDFSAMLTGSAETVEDMLGRGEGADAIVSFIIEKYAPYMEVALTKSLGRLTAIRPAEKIRISRGTLTHGTCAISYESDAACRLSFSRNLFFTGNAHAIIDTVCHELLHAALPAGSGHGADFRRGMEILNRALGISIAVHGEKEDVRIPENTYRYKIVCGGCGATFYRMKASALVLHPKRYRCAKCGKSAFCVYDLRSR